MKSPWCRVEVVKPRQKVRLLLVIPCVCAILVAWGVLCEPAMLVERYIKHHSWPGSALKIAFFSDLHAGSPHIDGAYIDNLVKRINSEAPHLILIGGDLVTNGVIGGTLMSVGEVARLVGKLKAPLGVFAVLGNHDWWRGGAAIASALGENGIKVLENQAVLIDDGHGAKFWLVGIGDDFTGHSDSSRAFAMTDTSWPKIVFMHDPGALFQIKSRFAVAFAGHLHGGQIFVPGIGALVTPGRAPRAWAKREWIDLDVGSLLVSSGLGTSILPIRLNALPEYVIADLNPGGVNGLKSNRSAR